MAEANLMKRRPPTMPDNKELADTIRTVIQEELNPVRQELHELRTGQDELRTGQHELRSDMNELRTDMNELRTGQVELRTDVDVLITGQVELRSGLDELRIGQDVLTQDVGDLKLGQKMLENKVDKLEVRMENEVIEKISVLFDGHNLRGEQIKDLKTHFDERFDRIETDTRYLVSRVSRLENLAK
jgi:predicted nuclease with TOPRIM domain